MANDTTASSLMMPSTSLMKLIEMKSAAVMKWNESVIVIVIVIEIVEEKEVVEKESDARVQW